MKVLCLWYANEEEIARIQSGLPNGTEVVAPKGEYLSRFDCAWEDVKDLAPEADAILAFSVPPGVIESATRLKMFSWLHSGVDDLRLIGAVDLFRKRGVKLANVRGANAVAVAEQAMMFVLALAKKTLLKHEAFVEGRLLFPLYDDAYRSGMLHQRTIGVIGLGQIGGRIAKHAKAFDMNVIGIRRDKSQLADFVDAVYGMEDLQEFLPKCDYVVLATPDTTETNGFFGKAELQAMKPSAYLINISRGMLTQERPLYEALTTNRIAGYASDVWWQYNYGQTFPIGWGSRLSVHQLPNVLVSNDQAANADDVLERNIRWGTENLAQFMTGNTIRREVRLDLGY